MMRRPLVVRVVAVLAATAALAGCAGPAGPAASGSAAGSGEEATREVRVAAASDLKFALDEIVALAERDDPALDVRVSYGSSGNLLTQVRNGAPFDLYLSADLAYAEELVAEGLADEGDLFAYGVGRLVLWTTDPAALDPAAGLEGLVDPAVRRIAIANPEHAPYGVAAEAALRSAGILDEVAQKLVVGENVAQAAEFVRSGNADAGLVALSLVLAEPLADVGAWAEVPDGLHPRLDQGGVVLAAAGDPEAARELRDLLLGPGGAAILARHGFAPPED